MIAYGGTIWAFFIFRIGLMTFIIKLFAHSLEIALSSVAIVMSLILVLFIIYIPR